MRTTIGEKIGIEKLEKLVHKSSVERIRYHLQHWNTHKKNQVRKGAGYFITVVENDIEPVEPEKNRSRTGRVLQMDNFEQREYTKEELERFYANLT